MNKKILLFIRVCLKYDYDHDATAANTDENRTYLYCMQNERSLNKILC